MHITAEVQSRQPPDDPARSARLPLAVGSSNFGDPTRAVRGINSHPSTMRSPLANGDARPRNEQKSHDDEQFANAPERDTTPARMSAPGEAETDSLKTQKNAPIGFAQSAPASEPLYVEIDGNRWKITRAEPAQIHEQVLASALLSDLGIRAPRRQSLVHEGELVLATEEAMRNDTVPGDLEVFIPRDAAQYVVSETARMVLEHIFAAGFVLGDEHPSIATDAGWQNISVLESHGVLRGQTLTPPASAIDTLNAFYQTPFYQRLAEAGGYESPLDIPTLKPQIGALRTLLNAPENGRDGTAGAWVPAAVAEYISARCPTLVGADREQLVQTLSTRVRDLDEIYHRYFHWQLADFHGRHVILPLKNPGPDVATSKETWKDAPNLVAVIPQDGYVEGFPDVLNGIPLSPNPEWKIETIPGIESTFPFEQGDASVLHGGYVIMMDGRIVYPHPSGAHGGYKMSTGQGTQENGETLQETAIREAFEELALQIEIVGFLCDYQRQGNKNKTRFYLAKVVGADLPRIGWETKAMSVRPYPDAVEGIETAPMIDPKTDKPLPRSKRDWMVLEAIAEQFPNLFLRPDLELDQVKSGDRTLMVRQALGEMAETIPWPPRPSEDEAFIGATEAQIAQYRAHLQGAIDRGVTAPEGKTVFCAGHALKHINDLPGRDGYVQMGLEDVVPLHETAGAKWLTEQMDDAGKVALTAAQTKLLWTQLSIEYAKSATGRVRAAIGGAAIQSTWCRYESVILASKGLPIEYHFPGSPKGLVINVHNARAPVMHVPRE